MQQLELTKLKKTERLETIAKALARGEVADDDSTVVVPALTLLIPFYHHNIDNKAGLRCFVDQKTFQITEAWFYRAKGEATNREVLLTKEELEIIKSYYKPYLQNLWSDFCKCTDEVLK